MTGEFVKLAFDFINLSIYKKSEFYLFFSHFPLVWEEEGCISVSWSTSILQSNSCFVCRMSVRIFGRQFAVLRVLRRQFFFALISSADAKLQLQCYILTLTEFEYFVWKMPLFHKRQLWKLWQLWKTKGFVEKVLIFWQHVATVIKILRSHFMAKTS